jgi:TolB-like protein
MKRAALATLALSALAIGRARPARADTGHPPVVAVFELEDATNRPRRLIAGLTDYLRVKLAESRAVKVVDKGDQETQLKKLIRSEKKKSYKACVDQSCQIPLGKELAADKILRGKLTRFGKSYVVAVEMIDLATGASAGAASEKSDGTEEALMASVERVAHTISAAVAPPKSDPVADSGDAPPDNEKPAAEVASAKPLPAAAQTAPSAETTPQATTQVKMESPGPTGTQWAMIIGGWAVFAGAYITEVTVQLITSDFSRAYYSLAPVIGPVLVEQLNKSSPVIGTDGMPKPYSPNALNYVDAGIQLVGAVVAVLGHILALTNAPVPVQAAPSSAQAGGVSVEIIALPRFVGLSGTF